MRLFKYLFALILLSSSVFSQQIVVSEYQDMQASPNGEWTEFLITRDGANLVNYIFRDNNSTDYRAWFGGIKFKDVPLWQNLKRGTIIVIQHRESSGFPYDYDPSDGYIEVPATNTTYFERYTPEPDPDPSRTWEDKALSIAEAHDILELIDGNGNHVHSLSHAADRQGGIWRELPDPKPNYPGTLAARNSIAISPGADLNAYLGVGGTSQVATFVQNRTTKGLPNNESQNSLFWRKLREPQWSAPSLTINVQTDGNQLSWTSSSDVNSDNCGYLIIRYKQTEASGVLAPSDGIIYQAGDVLGTATVIDNVANSTSYKDRSDLPCGEKYGYRVFAYRFNSGNYALEAIETNARGRQYNQTNYASGEFNKVGPERPSITIDGETTICKGDEVKMTINDDGGNYSYYWTRNNKKIDNATGKEYIATESGTYNAIIFDNATNCNVISDAITIKVIDYPAIKMTIEGVELKSDTTIIICAGNGKILKAFGFGNDASKYVWYKDGEITKSAVSQLVIFQSGEYYLSASNENLCSSNTPKVTLIVNDPKFTITPSNINFDLSSAEASAIQSVTITNTGDYDFEVKPSFLHTEFQIISPDAPYIVPAKSTLELLVRFLPSASGNYTDTLSFSVNCISEPYNVILSGHKDASILATNKSIINFANILSCEDNLNREETITLENTGDDVITILAPNPATPFSIVGLENFPIAITKGEIKSITIRFNNTTAGTYSEDMFIPYSTNGNKDSLLISLNGTISDPKISFPETTFLISTFTADNLTQVLDIPVNNIGDTEITIEKPTIEGIVFENLPLTIPAGESAVLHLTVSLLESPDYIYTFDLNSSPCDLVTSLTIRCASSGYYASKNEVNFGYIINCPNGGFAASESFEIGYFGEPSGSPSIAEVIQPKYFTCNLNPGDLIGEKLSAVIDFTGTEIGKYDDTLAIVIAPQNDTLRIHIYGEAVDIKMEMFDILYMPDSEVGSSSQKSLKVKNSNPFDVTLISVSEVYPPFYTDGSQIYPQILTPNGEWNVNFTYSPTAEGTHYSGVKLTFKVGNCTFDSVITVKGSTGESNEPINLEVKFDAPNKVKVGTTVNIPLNMTLKTDGVSYLVARISHVEFDLEYNESVVTPVGLIQGQSIAAGNYKIEKISKNISHCSFDILEPESMYDGQFFSIRSRILWGNSNILDYKIKNLTYTANREILSDADSASMEIIGDCAFDTGLIEVGNSSNLGINQTAGNLEISYTLVSEDAGSIEIYNTAGERVFAKDVSGARGNYSISTTIPNSGVYFAVLRNGNFPRIVKFVIE